MEERHFYGCISFWMSFQLFLFIFLLWFYFTFFLHWLVFWSLLLFLFKFLMYFRSSGLFIVMKRLNKSNNIKNCSKNKETNIHIKNELKINRMERNKSTFKVIINLPHLLVGNYLNRVVAIF